MLGIRERTEYPAATTAFPLPSDLTYNLLERDFDVMQSVLRIHFLRRELDGGDTGEEDVLIWKISSYQ